MMTATEQLNRIKEECRLALESRLVKRKRQVRDAFNKTQLSLKEVEAVAAIIMEVTNYEK